MKIKVFQKGFNFSQDGPGNRLVYHLQGCNMACMWCSNPEGINEKGSIMMSLDTIDEACPKGAIVDGVFDSKLCKGCDRPCLENKDTSLSLSYKEYEFDDLIDEAISCKPMFFSSGGVTFTGGEPTLNLPLLTRLLKELKAQEINTTIETNATHPDLMSIIDYVDYLIMDLKHYNKEKHRIATKVSSALIKRNIEQISQIKPFLLRIPLIGGFNDDLTDAQGFIDHLENVNKENIKVEFLQFHEYGKHKWAQCGLTYAMTGNEYVSNERVKEFSQAFENAGFKVVNT